MPWLDHDGWSQLLLGKYDAYVFYQMLVRMRPFMIMWWLYDQMAHNAYDHHMMPMYYTRGSWKLHYEQTRILSVIIIMFMIIISCFLFTYLISALIVARGADLPHARLGWRHPFFYFLCFTFPLEYDHDYDFHNPVYSIIKLLLSVARGADLPHACLGWRHPFFNFLCFTFPPEYDHDYDFYNPVYSII